MMKAFCRILATAGLLWAPLRAGAAVLQGDPLQALGHFGYAASELEDLNGDGRWEFLVGAPLVDLGGTDDGRAYLWYGGTSLTAAANLVLAGSANEQFGFCVARVGDVNGDGRPDFAVGAPRYSQNGADHGRVYLFFGGPALDATPDAVLECPDATDGPQFGFSVSAAGDFNGDGLADLVVGAPYDDTAGMDAGSAYIFYGSTSLAQLVTVDLALRGTAAYDHFGWSVTDGGNFFRDGRACVAVGAPANFGTTLSGKVQVFRGSATVVPGPDAFTDLTLVSSSASTAGTWFGYAVRGLGDWDHDGDDDLAVGAPRDNTRGLYAGRAEIFFGGVAPAATAARYANGQDGGDLCGWSLADLGDVTGDGRTDLLIGAPGVATTATGAGAAYIFAGGGASADSPASLYLTLTAAGVNPGTEANDAFGACVSSAGDLDGDGRRDYAVGAPTGNVSTNAESGYVRLYDSSGEVVPVLLQAWQAVWTADGEARLSFALAEPAAAFRALTLWRDVTPRDGPPAVRTLACAGPLDGGGLPLTIAGGAWTLVDRPPALVAGSTLGYALVLERADGGVAALEGLAGPPTAEVGRLALRPPCPNPFNPRTAISFQAPAGAPVACRIYDPRGRLVATLYEGSATGLWQTVAWDGRRGGRPAAAGVYAVRLAADGRVVTRLAVLAK
ncbi:MAG: VCBS repeat-containing protein [Candidatus Krumholzibacteriia bacterium]